MSQVSPSVSHQLAAASIAFRRARKKFPKDYGIKNEAISARRGRNDQQPVSSSSAKCMTGDAPCFCSQSACSDDGSRYLSLKQSSLIGQKKCTCRRRDEESYEEATRWSNDRSAIGDALDKIPTRERYKEDDDSRKSMIEPYNHSTEREGGKCGCRPTSPRKRFESGPFKSETVNLLYVAPDEERDPPDPVDDHGCLVEEDEAWHHFSRENSDDREVRRSCSKLDRSLVKREEKISPSARTCDPRSPRDINLDLLRSSPEDHRTSPCHRYPSCSRYSCRRRCCNCCQQKSERISNSLPVGCTCRNRRSSSRKNHERTRPCGRKKKEDDRREEKEREEKEEEEVAEKDEEEKEKEEEEEEEEEEEDEEEENVGVIDHKDSIAILMEKYKSRNARNEHFEKERKNRSEMEKRVDRIKDRCENSSISRAYHREYGKDITKCTENSRNHRDRCRCQENRRRWEEEEEERMEGTLLLDDGRNRIRGEGDFYRRKEPARSRFEAPRRHTF